MPMYLLSTRSAQKSAKLSREPESFELDLDISFFGTSDTLPRTASQAKWSFEFQTPDDLALFPFSRSSGSGADESFMIFAS